MFSIFEPLTTVSLPRTMLLYESHDISFPVRVWLGMFLNVITTFLLINSSYIEKKKSDMFLVFLILNGYNCSAKNNAICL